MRVVISSPYGQTRGDDKAAVTFLHLLAAYLSSGKLAITKIICDGCFSICYRDLDAMERSCAACQKEQLQLADWCDLNCVKLSDYIQQDTHRQMLEESKSEKKLSKNLIQIKEAIVNQSNLGSDRSQRLHQSSLLALLAGDNLFKSLIPDLFLVTSPQDPINAAMLEAASERSVRAAGVMLNNAGDSIVVKNYHSGESEEFPIFMTELSSARNDTKTWATEILEIMQKVANLLEFQSKQLTLPLGR